MELGLFRDFFGKFSTRGKRYYFHMEGSWNIGKLGTRENSNFFFGGGDLWLVGWGIQGEVCEVSYVRWGMQGEVWVEDTRG